MPPQKIHTPVVSSGTSVRAGEKYLKKEGSDGIFRYSNGCRDIDLYRTTSTRGDMYASKKNPEEKSRDKKTGREKEGRPEEAEDGVRRMRACRDH
jgi:hypothetical protein